MLFLILANEFVLSMKKRSYIANVFGSHCGLITQKDKRTEMNVLVLFYQQYCCIDVATISESADVALSRLAYTSGK